MAALMVLLPACGSTGDDDDDDDAAETDTTEATTDEETSDTTAAAEPAGPICEGTLQLGVLDEDVEATAAAAAEAGAEVTGDGTGPRAGEQRLIDTLNEAGGIAGCTVEPVYYAWDFTKDWVQQGEEACALFTQDNDVFAAVILVNANRNLLDCLVNAGTVQLWSQFQQFFFTTEELEELSGSVYSAFDVAIDRKGPIIDMLAEAGYFAEGAQVGLIVSDMTNARYMVDEIYMPKLEELGVEVVAEAILPQPTSLENTLGDVAAATGNAVLQFKDAGVDHVFFTGGGGSFLFTALAERQAYRPRYAMSSDDTMAIDIPPVQLENALAVSWTPQNDFRNEDLRPSSPAAEHCVETYSADDPDNAPISFCDLIEFLKAGLEGAPEMTGEGFGAGVEALGTSFETAIGLGPTELGPGRHDGGAAMQLATYDVSAESFKYEGSMTEIP